MSDYYHHFLSSMSGVGALPNANQSPQDPTPPSTLPLGAGPMPNPYQSLGYFTGFPEPVMFSAPKAQRNRRKSAPGLDHVKHRRTRSGCYTCRSRRVKCDETRPTCERCRKGKRECVYPEPQTARQSGSHGAKDSASTSQQTSPDSSHGDDEEEMEYDSKLDTIPDEDEQEQTSAPQHVFRSAPTPRRSSTTSSLQRIVTATRLGSETPSIEGNKSSSPSTSTGTASSLTPATYQFPEASLQAGGYGAEWSHLPQELRYFLGYFAENITHYHYGVVNDSHDFFRTILPSMAARNEALLYSVVGFAAYHHTLRNPQGKMEQFLKYYNKAVRLLLGFLKRKERHNLATLLTILQLATIEEYLGDWVNLMGHQKAAFEVLNQLLTPQSAMQTPTGRTILSWYSRFDISVSLMGGFETALSQEWFSSFVDHCAEQLGNDPDNLGWKLEECAARLRLISAEMSVLFGKRAKGEIVGDAFAAEHERIAVELKQWKDGLDPDLTDPTYAVQDFSYGRPLEAGDIVNPFQPGALYGHPLFQTTVLTCEWHAAVITHQCQAGMGMPEEPPAELMAHAYAICQIFEAAELWPASPPGCLVIIQACLAMAALFLPRDDRHHMWVRRKFALLEAMGYVFPLTMRMHMAELFRDQSCVRWWLPDDEGFSPIVRSVRAFADERNATAATAQTESLRDVHHIFARMQLGRARAASTSAAGPAEPDYGGASSAAAMPASAYPSRPASDHGLAIGTTTPGGSAK